MFGRHFNQATDKPAKRLRLFYGVAMGLIIVLTVSAHWFSRNQVAAGASIGTVVNVAGRQRMLSQRIPKVAYRIVNAAEDGNGQVVRSSLDELDTIAGLWRDSHERLITADGKGDLQMPGAETDAGLARLAPAFARFDAAEQQFVSIASSYGSDAFDLAELTEAANALDRASVVFLPLMHEVVGLYEAQGNDAVTRILRLKTVVLALVLLTIAAEVLFIFEPISRMIARHVDAVNEARREAERHAATRRAFLNHMGHELRTPLTSIISAADTLSGPKASAEARATAERTIGESGRRLLRFIDDLLMITQSEVEGKLSVIGSCKTDAAITEAISLVRPIAIAGGQDIRLEREGLIPSSLPIAGRVMRRIMVSLLRAVLDRSSDGSVHVEVQVTPDGAGADRRLLVSVWNHRNTNDGDLSFDPPFDLGEHGEQQQWLEISDDEATAGPAVLRIAQGLARLANGDIKVISQTTRHGLELQLPLGEIVESDLVPFEAEAVSTDRVRMAQSKSRERRQASLRGYRVMLVEDGAENRQLIGFLLEQAGAEVSLACDGVEAVEMLTDEAESEPMPCPDLIFMDIEMPRMDGRQATRVLRAKGVEAPIVALTAHSNDEERALCLAGGFDGFETKPITLQGLIEAVRTHAKRRPEANEGTPREAA